MAIQTKLIKHKMRSVSNIKKITKTMEMVSISKMKKAVFSAVASKEYFEASLDLLGHISKETYLKNNLYFKKRTSGKNLIVVIASDKGLCGSYNSNIYKSLSLLKKRFGQNIECIVVGKYAEKSAQRLEIPILASFIKLTNQNSFEEISRLSKIVVKNFKEKDYKNISVLYTEFIKSSNFAPSLKEILPIKEDILQDILKKDSDDQDIAEKPREISASYTLDPGEETILEKVIPRLTDAVFHQAYLEAQASEHSARMFAMKAASDNASSMLENLTLSFNHARQDAVTKELSEIVGGATALEIA